MFTYYCERSTVSHDDGDSLRQMSGLLAMTNYGRMWHERKLASAYREGIEKKEVVIV